MNDTAKLALRKFAENIGADNIKLVTLAFTGHLARGLAEGLIAASRVLFVSYQRHAETVDAPYEKPELKNTTVN